MSEDGRPSTRQRRRAALLGHARAGRIPAEALDPDVREHLFYELWQRGWRDVEIAAHTRSTSYTVARIRGRWGLPGNDQERR